MLKADVLRAMGGSANSLLWTQIKSDITGKPMVVPASDTATTLGLAHSGRYGRWIFIKDYEETVFTDSQRETRRHEPGSKNKAVYDKTF